MPNYTEAKQRAASLALAAKRGQIKKSDLEGAAVSMFEALSERELEEIAARPGSRASATGPEAA